MKAEEKKPDFDGNLLDTLKKFNDFIKDLDPLLKQKLIDIKLYEIYGDKFLKVISKKQKDSTAHISSSPETNSKADELFGDEELNLNGLRDFINKINPSTHAETIAGFAYFLEKFKGVSEFNLDIIEQCYYELRLPEQEKPKALKQLLQDSKIKTGYLSSGKRRGYYRLSSKGESIISEKLERNKEGGKKE